MPRDAGGHADLAVAADVLVKVEPESPPVPDPEVRVVDGGDWREVRAVRDIAGASSSQRFILPRGPGGEVDPEIWSYLG